MRFPAFEPIDLKSDDLSIVEIPINSIVPDPNQPRQEFDQASLDELAQSIKKYGIIQPIILKNLDDDKYQLIAGERRWRASKISGLSVIPAIVHQNNKKDNIAISLIENIQREQLNPVELSFAFHKLSNDYSLSHESIALMVGKSRATITNIMRLASLAPEVIEHLKQGKIEMGHARAMLSLSHQDQTRLSEDIIRNKLTVRSVEAFVKNSKKSAEPNPYIEEVAHWENRISQIFSAEAKVKINQKGEGKVIIHFNSPEEIDWFVGEVGKINQ